MQKAEALDMRASSTRKWFTVELFRIRSLLNVCTTYHAFKVVVHTQYTWHGLGQSESDTFVWCDATHV